MIDTYESTDRGPQIHSSRPLGPDVYMVLGRDRLHLRTIKLEFETPRTCDTLTEGCSPISYTTGVQIERGEASGSAKCTQAAVANTAVP